MKNRSRSAITVSSVLPTDPCLSLGDEITLEGGHDGWVARLRCIHYFRDNQGVTHYYMEPVE